MEGQTVGAITEVSLNERRSLGQDGVITVVALIDTDTGELAEPLDFLARGFGPGGAGLGAVTSAVQKALGELAGAAARDPQCQEQAIERTLSVWIRRTYDQAPVIIPVRWSMPEACRRVITVGSEVEVS